MSKYDIFEDFMQNVINEADDFCCRHYRCSLASYYHVTDNTVSMVGTILKNGWWLLPCLVALLVMGKFGFGAALFAFCAAGPGLIIVGLLAGFGGIAAIRYLYKERIFPIAVKKTGDEFRAEFERHVNDKYYIDLLTQSAVNYLISLSQEKFSN